MVVVLVGAQVLGELLDAVGEDRDLDLGGAGVALMGGVLGDELGFCFFGNLFISPSVLKDSFAKKSILDWKFFLSTF